MPLMQVKNVMHGPTIFVDDAGRLHKWMPAGDSMDRDVIRLSTSLLDDANFLAALESGALEFESYPESVAEEVAVIEDGLRRPRKARRNADEVPEAIEALMDRRQDKDMVGLTCVGPASAGRHGHCVSQVIMASKLQGEVPPLCAAHKHQETQFVPTVIGSKGDVHDPYRITWTRASGITTN